MKTTAKRSLLIILVLVLLASTMAMALPAYINLVSYNGYDTAAVNVTQFRSSADYPAIISTKPDPSSNTYYDVIVQNSNGYWLVINNAWVMKNDDKIHGTKADPFPDAPQYTPTPGGSGGSGGSSSSSNTDWYAAGQSAIDTYFRYLPMLVSLELIAILVMLIRKLEKTFRKFGKSRG